MIIKLYVNDQLTAWEDVKDWSEEVVDAFVREIVRMHVKPYHRYAVIGTAQSKINEQEMDARGYQEVEGSREDSGF